MANTGLTSGTTSILGDTIRIYGQDFSSKSLATKIRQDYQLLCSLLARVPDLGDAAQIRAEEVTEVRHIMQKLIAANEPVAPDRLAELEKQLEFNERQSATLAHSLLNHEENMALILEEIKGITSTVLAWLDPSLETQKPN